MKKGPLIIALIGLALLAFLYFSPVVPPGNNAEDEQVTEQKELTGAGTPSPDAEVEEALRQLQNREVPPMQAIMKIREVAEKHPGNVKANFTLGILSLQTGQFDKAQGRFETVIEQEPGNGRAWRLLAEAQLRSGDTTSATQSFTKALELVNSETGDEFKKELPELSSN